MTGRIRCGTVAVPREPARPAEGSLDLMVLVGRAVTPTPGAAPIFVDSGGWSASNVRSGAQQAILAPLVAQAQRKALANGEITGHVFECRERPSRQDAPPVTETVAGTIAPGTAFDPDIIAETFWGLHKQTREDWQAEVVFDERT